MAQRIARKTTRVRLTRKLAHILNGIDFSSINVGDILELPESAAAMMIAERWAERVEENSVTNRGDNRLTLLRRN